MHSSTMENQAWGIFHQGDDQTELPNSYQMNNARSMILMRCVAVSPQYDCIPDPFGSSTLWH